MKTFAFVFVTALTALTMLAPAHAQRAGYRGSGPSTLNPELRWDYFERARPPEPLIDPSFSRPPPQSERRIPSSSQRRY